MASVREVAETAANEGGNIFGAFVGVGILIAVVIGGIIYASPTWGDDDDDH